MEMTMQEREQLRIRWKMHAEIGRKLRQQEREEYLLQMKQIFISVFFTLLTIFSVSGWIVSRVLPFKH